MHLILFPSLAGDAYIFKESLLGTGSMKFTEKVGSYEEGNRVKGKVSVLCVFFFRFF